MNAPKIIATSKLPKSVTPLCENGIEQDRLAADDNRYRLGNCRFQTFSSFIQRFTQFFPNQQVISRSSLCETLFRFQSKFVSSSNAAITHFILYLNAINFK